MTNSSLLIPCYNAEPFLLRLWSSLDSMTTRFDEVIAYDDGSTDNTVAVARAIGIPLVVGTAHHGVAFARNRLAENAVGQWIHFQDVDDPIKPDFLQKLGQHCNGPHDLVTCDADWLDEGSRSLQISWRYDADALKADAARHLLSHPMSLNNSLIRRDAWLSVGGCNERLSMWEDADVHFRLALAGALFHHESEVLTWSLRRRDTASHDYRRNWGYRLQALKEYASLPAAKRLLDVIGSEAEIAAINLLRLKDRRGAREAVALSLKCGHCVPSTKNRVLLALRTFMSSYRLLSLQVTARQIAALERRIADRLN
jgi:glycosyltransferase involved in cell wall biosynthesis